MQVELECNSCITADKLREAFYASMIPQEKYLRLGWIHRVVVHKKQVRKNPCPWYWLMKYSGTYTVEANQKWKKLKACRTGEGYSARSSKRIGADLGKTWVGVKI